MNSCALLFGSLCFCWLKSVSECFVTVTSNCKMIPIWYSLTKTPQGTFICVQCSLCCHIIEAMYVCFCREVATMRKWRLCLGRVVLVPQRSIVIRLSRGRSVGASICASVCPVHCGKMADRIRMPFGIIGRTGPGMRHIVEFGDQSTGRGSLGGEFEMRHCNQWGLHGIRVRQCRDAALFPNYFGQTC